MRRVEIYLTINRPLGWHGWRRVLVVRETDTKVLLMQPEASRILWMRRSEFEAARPKTIPRDPDLIRRQLDTAPTPPNPPKNWRALAPYIKANLTNHRWKEKQWD